MHLTVREEERIQIWAAAEMARRRLDRGVKLNYPEAIALICDEILERAREGSIPMLTDMMEYGATILKREDVMDRRARDDEDRPGRGHVPRRDEARHRHEPDPRVARAKRGEDPWLRENGAPPPLPESIVPDEAFEVGEPEKCGAIDFADDDIEINAGPTRR